MYMYQNKTAKDDSSFQSPERDLSKKRMTMVNGTGLTNIVVANSGQNFTSQMNLARQGTHGSVPRNKSTSQIFKESRTLSYGQNFLYQLENEDPEELF